MPRIGIRFLNPLQEKMADHYAKAFPMPGITAPENKMAYVVCCARCGSDHNPVEWKPLDNSDQFQYWTMCPTKRQPILMQTETL